MKCDPESTLHFLTGQKVLLQRWPISQARMFLHQEMCVSQDDLNITHQQSAYASIHYELTGTIVLGNPICGWPCSYADGVILPLEEFT